MKKIFYLSCLFTGITGSTIFSMQKSTLRRRGETLVQVTATAIGAGAGAYASIHAGCEAGIHLVNNNFEYSYDLRWSSCLAGEALSICCCCTLGAVVAYKTSKQIQKAIEVNKKND